MTFRLLFQKALLLCACLAALPAWAQGYPNKPLTWVVPFPPGGVTDNLSRLITKRLAETLGQPFVIDNKAGAGGSVGTEIAARAPADGYTMLLGTQGTLAANLALYKGLKYDPLKDFSPVHGLLQSPPILVVEASKPWKTLADLVKEAKASPGKLNFGSPGSGTGTHLVGELFQDFAGVKLVHVPYKGAAPALMDLLGHRVDLMFDYLSVMQPHIKAGKVRVLAVMAPKRLDALPDVPTIGELGYPGAELSTWSGVVMPAGTPPEAVAKIASALATLLADKAFTAQFTDVGLQPMIGMKEGELRKFIAEEQTRWSDIVRKSGATLN